MSKKIVHVVATKGFPGMAVIVDKDGVVHVAADSKSYLTCCLITVAELGTKAKSLCPKCVKFISPKPKKQKEA